MTGGFFLLQWLLSPEKGGLILTVIILEMPSYTFAVKSEKLLKARGISCELKRNINAAPGSCGYSLHVKRDFNRASEILKKNGIPFIIKEKGGG